MASKAVRALLAIEWTMTIENLQIAVVKEENVKL